MSYLNLYSKRKVFDQIKIKALFFLNKSIIINHLGTMDALKTSTTATVLIQLHGTTNFTTSHEYISNSSNILWSDNNNQTISLQELKILLASTQVLGVLIFTLFVDKLGRKVCTKNYLVYIGAPINKPFHS